MSEHKLTIIRDTREHTTSYDFAGYPDVVVIDDCLTVGDFSLPGFEDRISLERKRLDDLIGCLSQERARFERELARARNFEMFAIICECSLSDLTNGRYHSQMRTQAVIQSIAAFTIRYRCPFYFCGNRTGGELMTYSLLSKFAYEIRKRFECLQGLVSMDTGVQSCPRGVQCR
jgi:ERCC4-type nuclease